MGPVHLAGEKTHSPHAGPAASRLTWQANLRTFPDTLSESQLTRALPEVLCLPRLRASAPDRAWLPDSPPGVRGRDPGHPARKAFVCWLWLTGSAASASR